MTNKKNRSPIEQIEFTRNALAFILVAAFVLFTGALLFKNIPEKNEQLLSYMLGQLSGMALMGLGFYFVNKVGQDALDAKRTDNTSKALEAITATANASSVPVEEAVASAARQTADAAQHEADIIAGDKP